MCRNIFPPDIRQNSECQYKKCLNLDKIFARVYLSKLMTYVEEQDLKCSGE